MFNLANEKDIETVFDVIANSSDVGEESDDEITRAPLKKLIRIGSDEVHPVNKQEEILEEDTGSSAGSSSAERTKKKGKIVWRKHLKFEVPQFQWSVSKPSKKYSTLAPVEYFYKYITEDLIESFVSNTNLYAVQKHVYHFKPCTLSEMKVFIGLHIIAANLGFPRIRLFWDTDLDMRLFLENMARDRFFQLRNNFHMIDNSSIPADNTDRLVKVRPIYDAIRKRCLELELEQTLSVDEQIVPFRGRLGIKQYVKGKPEPWGIKIFMICGKSGLVYDFIIYQGSTTNLDKSDVVTYGQSAAVVHKLSQRIANPGHYLFFDNYFSNYLLLRHLRQRQIYAGGTIRLSRFGSPPLITDKEGAKKARGYAEEATNDEKDVIIVKWMDNKGIVLASNFVGIGETDKAQRWNKVTKKYIEVTRPELVRLYNQGMGGVDKADQLVSLYRIFIRSRKWTLRMIFHGVDTALTNSWLEYQEDCRISKTPKNEILDLLHFRQRVADALIKMGQPINMRKRGRPSASSSPAPQRQRITAEVRPSREIQYDTVDHLPDYDTKHEATRCKNPLCKGKTHVFCLKCKIHLCFTGARNCFKSFHLKE